MIGTNVFVTGSNGFIGRSVVKTVGLRSDFSVIQGARLQPANSCSRFFEYGELDGLTVYDGALFRSGVVIHLASVAHTRVKLYSGGHPTLSSVNVEGTLNLARQAAAAGVQRFIFISTIGVNGNINTKPFTEDDTPNPADQYAQSKWEAEQGLWEIQHETGLELVIIRPPLVYGPNAPGNFGSLTRWIEKGVPLPLGAINNQRSLVALDNLVDLILTCIDHPAAVNQVFLAGDGQDLSTSELLSGVAKAAGKPSRLIPIPSSLLMFAATLLGKKAMAQRLLGSLQVDISKARDLLGWEPPISVEEGLRRCFSKG